MRARAGLLLIGLVVAGCSGGSSPHQPPPLGTGQSLKPVPVYQVVDPQHPASHTRIIKMARRDVSGKVDHEITDRKPLFVLHATAAQVLRGTVQLKAPEAVNFFEYQQASGAGLFVAIIDGVGYQVGSIVGDTDGLDISVRVGRTPADQDQAIAIARSLTTRVRVL
jgi:hypothetical protein